MDAEVSVKFPLVPEVAVDEKLPCTESDETTMFQDCEDENEGWLDDRTKQP